MRTSSIAIEIGRSGFHEALASGGASGVVHPGCGGGAGPSLVLSPPPARRPEMPPLRPTGLRVGKPMERKLLVKRGAHSEFRLMCACHNPLEL